MINAVGVFLTNFTALGCYLILSKMPLLAIWKSFTLFGFLFGSSLAYFLKGKSVQTMRKIAIALVKEYKGDENIYKIDPVKKDNS